MKFLWIFILLSAAAFGQNSYGADFLNLHCTAPDANAPPNFGDAPRPGLVPASAATGNAVLYCDALTSSLKVSFSGGAYAGVGGGSGTVNANNGSAGAIAFYSAAGGSTTVGPDATLVDSGGKLTYSGASSLVSATATNAGVIALGSDGVVNISRNSNNNMTLNATGGSGIQISATNGLTVSSGNLTLASGGIIFSQGKGQHITTQAANSDISGVCSGTTTTCAVAFTSSYTSTPSCVLTPTTAGVTSFIITTQANTGFTVTYAPTGTTNFNYICIGNPN